MDSVTSLHNDLHYVICTYLLYWSEIWDTISGSCRLWYPGSQVRGWMLRIPAEVTYLTYKMTIITGATYLEKRLFVRCWSLKNEHLTQYRHVFLTPYGRLDFRQILKEALIKFQSTDFPELCLCWQTKRHDSPPPPTRKTSIKVRRLTAF